METRKWILGSLLVASLFCIGFLFGATYVAKDVDAAHMSSLIAQLKREDSVLRLLDKQQFERASEIQEKYLSATIFQLQLAGRRLPRDVLRLMDEYKDRKAQAPK